MKNGARFTLLFSMMLTVSPILSCASAHKKDTPIILVQIPEASDSPDIFLLQKLLALTSTGMMRPVFVKQIENVLPQMDQDKRQDTISKIVLGFLAKPDYSGHYSQDAIKKCRLFLRKYRTVLMRTEKITGVSAKVLTALIWVETRHGLRTGKNPILGVFAALAQANHPVFVRQSLMTLLEKNPAADIDLQNKVIERSESKAKWAIEQLIAMDQIHQNQGAWIVNVKGSYAGAFGAPQFIPSSYVSMARSYADLKTNVNRSVPDLNKIPDAISSVGFYLQTQGWKKEDPTCQTEALYHYNKSTDYGAVILKIAQAL